VRRERRDLTFLREPRFLPGTRVPIPEMVLVPNDIVIEEPNTGRRFHDVDQGVHPSHREALETGHMCLRCKEPHPEAFPKECDVCGYEMADRQMIDVAAELDGEIHVGPSRPLNLYMEELEMKNERHRFEKKIREGGSRGRQRRGR